MDNLIFGRPTSRGTVLRPTRKKRGEYDRLGLVEIHTESDALLAISRSPGGLAQADYLALIAHTGVTTTIV